MLKFIAAALLAAATAGPALAPFSSPAMSDYNLSTDRRERIAVFARSGPDFRNARIMVSVRGPKGWGEPMPIAFTSAGVSDSDPWLTPDGGMLYFVSDRPAAGREADRTDLDIWRSRRLPGGGWSAPEHLGPLVNGRGPELGPEVHSGVLTFSAARKSGKGGLDVYAAPQTAMGFGAPVLLEGPVNSAESDSDFTIAPDGRSAAFWRGSGGKGVIMVAARTPTGWGEPRALGPAVNRGAFNFTPAFSADGRRMTFASMAPGSDLADIFVASLR